MTIFNTFALTPLLRVIALAALKLSGWKLDIREPLKPPFVFIGAPHTSNWDLLLMLATVLVLRLDARWMGKHTLFRFPFRHLMLWLGGIPTDRTKPGNQVEQAAQLLRSNPGLILCVAPEGTRSKVKHWKSGFWHIARQAEVPIVLTLLDAPVRKLKVLGCHQPEGDSKTDIARIQQYYTGHQGLNPEKSGI